MKIKLLLMVLLMSLSALRSAFAQSATFTQRAPFPGELRCEAVSFSIANKGYMAGGFSMASGSLSDLWEYDMLTDTWTQLATIPDTNGWDGAVGFAINGKGYITTGIRNSAPYYRNDLWEYDPVLDSWTQKTSLPAAARAYSTSFVINNIAYVATGNGYNELWSYNPATDTWLQKTSIPTAGRSGAFSFSIGTKGFLGGGIYDTRDFWEYDAIIDTWTQKDSMYSQSYVYAIGWSLNNYGYKFGGRVDSLSSCLREYNPVTDTWTVLASNIPPYNLHQVAGASAMVINGNVFLTQGCNNAFFPDLLQVNLSTDISEANDQILFSCYPNPTSGTFTIILNNQSSLLNSQLKIYDVTGRVVHEQKLNSASSIISFPFSAGVYIVKVGEGERMFTQKLVVQ
jgi:N-acetylneuraminic acid mutarotase